MNEQRPQPNGDVNLEVVATGCGTSCGLGCIGVLLLFIMAMMMGAAALRHGAPPALTLMGLLIGLAIHVVVGYATARAARLKNAPVNLHIFVVGGLLTAFSLASNVLKLARPVVVNAPQPNLAGLGLLASFLIIPLMLWGASLYSDAQAPK